MTEFLDWARTTNAGNGVTVIVLGFACQAVMWVVLSWCDRHVAVDPFRDRGEH